MTQIIRTQPSSSCYLCGTTGELLYSDLTDRLFNAPGVWQIKRCPQGECGLLWLDPVPVKQDIARIYENYFTHQDNVSASGGTRRRIIHWIYRTVLGVTGLARQRSALFSLYLHDTRPGRLLDVGCGDGGRLARWQAMGWEVEGQEIDDAAAERARTNHGLDVHLGTLEAIALPNATFDVVTMSHVIEHVHDPVALLKECHRILKPGGQLIAVTPNVNSLGHERFGLYWLGLDPPRHLHLFSPATLPETAARAGFRQCSVWTTAASAQFFAEGSLCIKRYHRHRFGARPGLGLAVQTLIFQFVATAFHMTRPDSGEECVLKAVK